MKESLFIDGTYSPRILYDRNGHVKLFHPRKRKYGIHRGPVPEQEIFKDYSPRDPDYIGTSDNRFLLTALKYELHAIPTILLGNIYIPA
jgi:hypothetical protein